MLNILSIDLEDWFHILDHRETALPSQWEKFESRLERNTERILDILEEGNQRATWFCLGWIARKHHSLVRKISAKHHIACHSDLHELVYAQGAKRFREDTIRVKGDLEDIIGQEVNTYRASGFSVSAETPWFFDVLMDCGFKTDSSVFPAKRNHGGFPGFRATGPCRIQTASGDLKEFPMNVASVFGKKIVFSGGGYFRAIPYTIIRHFFNQSEYVMTYFHPRDFDPSQPVIESLPLKRKIMSYTGLKSSEKKFRRLLKDHYFVDLKEAEKSIDWESTPLIKP